MSRRVALVVMPFASEDGPMLGPSLLRAALRREGIACDLYYLNLRFAAQLGLGAYRAIDRIPSMLMGEWLFAASLFGDAAPPAENCITDADERRGLLERRRDAELFIEECRTAFPWETYDVVGFSSSFQQNTASLALAMRIKADHPRVKIVMGGANCEGEMGAALKESFPFLDEVISGEADVSFIELIKGTPFQEKFVSDLDALPFPDFSDYYRQLAEYLPSFSPGATHLRAETARGCWWGARAHCTFCGLNGDTMTFRRKSTERSIEELERLLEYPTRSVMMVDNILDEHAFDSFIPALIDRKLGLRLFYEIKSSLTRDQISLLSRAGIRRLQPGIESLSTDVLGRMRKGTRAIDNISLLKDATEEGVTLTWNFLCGFPKEKTEDHVGMTEMIPSLHHLQPPTGLFNVQVHRFSPFHSDPLGRGVGPIRPASAYAHIYPFDRDRLERLAYFFEPENPEPRPETIAPLAAAVTVWKGSAARGAGVLLCVLTPDAAHIVDTRGEKEIRERLDAPERKILIHCRAPQSALSPLEFDQEKLAGLVARHYLLHLDHRYLALPIMIDLEEGQTPDHALDVAIVTHQARMAAMCSEAGNGY